VIDILSQAEYNATMENTGLDNDWGLLLQFFPPGWEEQAKKLGALTRQRKFKSVSDLARLLLIHLAEGCSMREAVVRAKQGGLVAISDVALLKRLRLSSDWFRWMASELLKRRGIDLQPPSWASGYNIKSIDASVISEPGSTGTDWRLHYCMKLFGLQCDQFIITRQDVGESYLNFKVSKGDLLIGDRAYGRFKGMQYVLDSGGDFLTRFKSKAFTLFDQNDNEVNLIHELEGLAIGEIKNIHLKAAVKKASQPLNLRLCAIRKSEKEAEESIKKVLREQNKKQRKIYSDTVELHRYVILLTSLPEEISPANVMELYRLRWQIEIAFKRLKSILGLGHLPKIDQESSRAWLHGKFFVAALAQSIVDEGRFFSPWGYPAQS
jgi:hypothetical protein